MDGVLVEIARAVKRHRRGGVLLFQSQQIGRAIQVVEHEPVGSLQRGPPHRLVTPVVLREHHAQTFAVPAVVLVSLAEALDELRVGQRAGEISFAAALVEQIQRIVVGRRLANRIDPVEQEVAAIDDFVERAVDRFDFGVGGVEVVPAPNVAVNARIAVHAVDQVGLDVGQQGQSARIECRTLEGVVNADDQLVHVLDRFDRLVCANGIFRIFVQTGGERERRSRQHRIGFYFLNHLCDSLECDVDTQRVLTCGRILSEVDVARVFGIQSGEIGKSQQVLPLQVDTHG